jgi:tetratricopeptide (TPR) repeat protein
MRGLILLAASLAAMSACAKRPVVAVPEAQTPAARLAAADALVAAGCLDCLVEAHRHFDALRSEPMVADRAASEAIRTAVLIAIREHELGIADGGYIVVARRMLAALPAPSPQLATIVNLGEVLVAGPSGPSRVVTLEAQTLALVRLSENQPRWAGLLRQRMPDDAVAAYLWLSMACGIYGSAVPDNADRATVAGSALDVPLVAFKDAISCARNRTGPLQQLIGAEPKFREIHFYQGLAALAGQPRPGEPGGAPDLESADQEFRTAYEWRQDWPTLTLTIANLALTFEDFARAVDFYERTLGLVPRNAAALLGKIRTLTYLQKHDAAIAAADELLETGDSSGEARYWRALNQEQLGEHDLAWADVELADKVLLNGDVPKLAGIIAINRRELEVARMKLELALKRRAPGCDSGYYLQMVLSEQRNWERVATAAAAAATCFDNEEATLLREIEQFKTAKMPPERRDRQIARRDRQIAGNARMRAAAWFNAAASSYNLGRSDDARQFAERLVGDQQFDARAHDLLNRLRR